MEQCEIGTAAPSLPPVVLRPYQNAAILAAENALKESQRTLVVLATGLGKTIIACEMMRRSPGRCLFVAHRDELIQQAAGSIERVCGRFPELEQADFKANNIGSNHVVASIQSLSRPKRLQRFQPDAFDLVIVDECHHSNATTYQRVMNYFNVPCVGITATPDRSDGKTLGNIFQSLAYRYDIIDAIQDGWLCDVVVRRVVAKSIDLSSVHTVAGDFAQDELERLMLFEKNLHAIAKPTVDLSGDRRTIVFATSVAHAERLAEIINRYTGKQSAFMVSGETPKDRRRRLLKQFRAGEFQFFVNVGIATEGYDEPGVSCIVMGRPTKSRSLYTQMLGRGTRGGRLVPVAGKQDLLILDFAANTGKHSVVCSVDVLSQCLDDRTVERIKKIQEAGDKPSNVNDDLAEVKRQEMAERLAQSEAKRRNIQAEVEYRVERFQLGDACEDLGVSRDFLYAKYGLSPATENQINGLQKWMGKHAKRLPLDLSKHEAAKMLSELSKRRESKLASYGQVVFLGKKGVDARPWPFSKASSVIDWIAHHGWANPPQSVIDGAR